MGSSSSVMTSATVGNEGFVGIVPKSSNSASRKTRHAVVNSLPTKKIISVQIETLVDSVVKGMSSFTPRRLSTKPNSETSLSIPSVETLKHTEAFMDSFYIQNYLSQEEADELFECLAIIGEAQRPKDTSIANKMHSKYPLWTKYYGLARSLDGARALDRWGSYHESWTRVSEPPTALARVAERLRKTSSTQEVINSMVVNYYYDGQNTYIPAHRDTTACLQDNSIIYCLSLGATRDFILCSNEDAGKYSYNDINHVIKKYSVSHGDLFALGVKTNESYCHAVPQENHVQNMRISVIFRSVDKSFIDVDNATEKVALYATGREKIFAAECVTTSGYSDIGTREHISDLISNREQLKKEQKLALEIEKQAKNLRTDKNGEVIQLESYYMGRGTAVPV